MAGSDYVPERIVIPVAGKAGIIASLIHTVLPSAAPTEPVSNDLHHHMAGVISSVSEPDSIR